MPHPTKNYKVLLFHVGVALVASGCYRISVFILNHWADKKVVAYVDRASTFMEHPPFWVELIFVAVTISLYNIAIRITRGYKLGGTAKAAGMFYYSPNSDDRTVIRNNNFLRKKSTDCKHLKIMGATGWHTFGKRCSPLHEAINNCDSAEIILFSPLSDFLEDRSTDVGQKPDEYGREIYWSILFLKSLIDGPKPIDIKLKLCDSYPGWKYMFLDPYVWVQQYPKTEHVVRSPSYAYQRIDMGIYDQLYYQFTKRWKSPWVCDYDFENTTVKCAKQCPSAGDHSIKRFLDKANLSLVL